MRKLWDKIVAWFLRFPADKRLHFAAGIVIAAFFAIALGMKFCFWPVIFFAFGKELWDVLGSSHQDFDFKDFAATLIGALVPQSFALLNIWWFPN
ncbi:MAG: hypothetical protein J5699_04605 [Bacteroidales bacterium]|nr:hypothetical protein [Bacteroidales bacterium]